MRSLGHRFGNALLDVAISRGKFAQPHASSFRFGPGIKLRFGQMMFNLDKITSREQDGSTVIIHGTNAEINGREFTFRASFSSHAVEVIADG